MKKPAYINVIVQKVKSIIPQKKVGQTFKEYDQIVKERGFQIGIVVLMAVAVISSVTAVTRNIVTVSNSVNGRELPVYCVETDKKQVALSFDAAWGND